MNKRLKISYEKMYGKNLNMDEYKEIYKYIKKDSRLLDVGCDYRIFLDKFWKTGSGIDNNIEHVKICKEKNLDAKYGEAEKYRMKIIHSTA